jgi:hypothetical protein
VRETGGEPAITELSFEPNRSAPAT